MRRAHRTIAGQAVSKGPGVDLEPARASWNASTAVAPRRRREEVEKLVKIPVAAHKKRAFGQGAHKVSVHLSKEMLRKQAAAKREADFNAHLHKTLNSWAGALGEVCVSMDPRDSHPPALHLQYNTRESQQTAAASKVRRALAELEVPAFIARARARDRIQQRSIKLEHRYLGGLSKKLKSAVQHAGLRQQLLKVDKAKSGLLTAGQFSSALRACGFTYHDVDSILRWGEGVVTDDGERKVRYDEFVHSITPIFPAPPLRPHYVCWPTSKHELNPVVIEDDQKSNSTMPCYPKTSRNAVSLPALPVVSASRAASGSPTRFASRQTFRETRDNIRSNSDLSSGNIPSPMKHRRKMHGYEERLRRYAQKEQRRAEDRRIASLKARKLCHDLYSAPLNERRDRELALLSRPRGKRVYALSAQKNRHQHKEEIGARHYHAQMRIRDQFCASPEYMRVFDVKRGMGWSALRDKSGNN